MTKQPTTKTTQPTPKRQSTWQSVVVILALLLSTTSLTLQIVDYLKGDVPITFTTTGTDGNSANFQEGSIADIAKQVTPSVVSVVTETRTTSWFGQEQSATAAGTGVIVSANGYILTNKHVVDGAEEINIITDDGTTYTKVTVAATDPINDIAFLKIQDVDNLPAAKLGDSKTINVGQQVIAIGNALGQFQNTVSSGIISGTGRSVTATNQSATKAENLTDMIQTDTAINAGNSGGPLVNAAGEVIGINTAVSSQGQGIGFAIPISSIKGMLKSLVKDGTASRAYLGIYYLSITPEIAKAYDLPVSVGAYVYSNSQYTAVLNGSPAAKAGLKDKDIIVSINGTKVGVAGSVSSLIGEYQVGDTIQFSILRGGQTIAINVTLGAYQQ